MWDLNKYKQTGKNSKFSDYFFLALRKPAKLNWIFVLICNLILLKWHLRWGSTWQLVFHI